MPQACAVDGLAYVQFTALGDFEPTAPAGGHTLGEVGEALPEIVDSARAVVAEVTENSRTWTGIASVPPSGDVDLLLLPSMSSCPFSASVGQRDGALLAAMSGGRVLVVGGSGNPVPGTFVVDLTTGDIAPIDPAMGLPQARTRASVTAFGDGALVAGGFADGAVLADAVVYEPDLDGFDQARPVPIGDGRADQGAVVLASGVTLLVGGVGTDGHTPLASMELVDPETRTVRTEHVAQLAVARRLPTTLRLASGEILVAGGVDENDNPISTLEWFAPDGSAATKRAQDLVTGPARAFAPLAGGGALAVIAPPTGSPPTFQNVWVIDADGALEAAQPIQGSLTLPVLFGGAGGSPVLWTGDRWLRWQPWSGSFGPLDILDASPAKIGPTVCSPDPGLALWIDADAPTVTALRFDVRGEYSPLAGPLLVDDLSDVAPDRLPSAVLFSFDPAAGLTLSPGASAFITDRAYAGVDISVDSPTGEPAIVVLRDEQGVELEVGGDGCPGVVAAGALSAHVTRRGATVGWSGGAGLTGTCASGVQPDARLSIGLRAPDSVARSIVRNLRVARVP